MGLRLWGVGTLPKLNDPEKRLVSLASLLAFACVTAFIVTELFAVSAALVWAVAGLLHLPPWPTAALGAIVALPTAWSCAATAILAFNAETDPENNPPAA